MSKGWYPVINYEVCNECGACFNKCTNNVFTLRNKRPVVENPEYCIEKCIGCRSFCPTDAIEYVGDPLNKCCNGFECCNC